MTESPTWKDVVRDALAQLGGKAHLSEINALVENHPKTRTNPTWRDTIRRVVRQYKLFEPVLPNRSGVYRLAQPVAVELGEQPLTRPEHMTHGALQGMLVALGSLYGYETFAPVRDQTTATFRGKQLAELVSLNDCTDLFRGPNVGKIREIDVLWFDEDDYGAFPAYAFEIEQTTKVTSGLDRLLKIPKRFHVDCFIVGPTEKERRLFERVVAQSPFSDHRGKFRFRLYAEVAEVYSAALLYREHTARFGVRVRYTRPG